MIIDGHVHLGQWTDAWYPALGVGWRELDRELTACGVTGALVTATDQRDNEELLSPPTGLRGRYWRLPWINPREQGELSLLDGWGTAIAGIKIHPSANHVPADDPLIEPYLALARERGWIVLVHCGRWQEMSGFSHALAAAAKFPQIPFVLAHMGGDTPSLALGTQEALQAQGSRNVWLGIEGMREYWVVDRGISRLGVERFLYGSDYPIGHPRMYMGLVDALGLDKGEKELILGGNLSRILDGSWSAD